MDVAPGDIIHMDENGACKFPADRLAEVCKNVDAFKKEEDQQVKALTAAKTFCRKSRQHSPAKRRSSGHSIGLID